MTPIQGVIYVLIYSGILSLILGLFNDISSRCIDERRNGSDLEGSDVFYGSVKIFF
jgi:hypothetical protein